MRKTTVYLPDELKADLERLARASGRSEADLVRAGIRDLIEHELAPRPTLPLFRGTGRPRIAHDEKAMKKLIVESMERDLGDLGKH
ncbi:MAG TPA: CopG family transcriptional regulator [Solirubrobacteraceae bacterium]|nr:CopG family transcriptional regulator [Solirubrobacteraceae bacterium]